MHNNKNTTIIQQYNKILQEYTRKYLKIPQTKKIQNNKLNKAQQNTTKYNKIQQNDTKYNKIIQNTTKYCNKILQHTRRILQNNT